MKLFSSRAHEKYEPGHRDGDGCVFPDPGHFAPRPTNPTNPILAELRRSAPWVLADAAATELEWVRARMPIPSTANSAHIDHASRVLERLVRIGGSHG